MGTRDPGVQVWDVLPEFGGLDQADRAGAAPVWWLGGERGGGGSPGNLKK